MNNIGSWSECVKICACMCLSMYVYVYMHMHIYTDICTKISREEICNLKKEVSKQMCQGDFKVYKGAVSWATCCHFSMCDLVRIRKLIL